MTHSNYLNSGLGVYGIAPVGAGCGRQDALSARVSAAAACRKFGRGKSSFTADDVAAAYPQHHKHDIGSRLAALVRAGLAYRVSPGVYRLAGEV